jgi:hypothetical protein
LELAFAGDALAAGAGQGFGAVAVDVDEDAAGFFLKSEPNYFAAFFILSASAERLELFWVAAPFAGAVELAVAPQAACAGSCVPLCPL